MACRRVADELHEHPDWLRATLRHVRPDAEQLRAEDTGSSLWLLGDMLSGGRGGVERNREEAFRCFSRAAEKGHLLSRWKVGIMTADGDGVLGDITRGYALMVEAAQAGCPEAFYWAAEAYKNGTGVQQSYRRAAQLYLKDGSDGLAVLLRAHPLQCAPLGEWQPELTPLLPREILQAMRATMLLCKRMRIPHGVAMMIIPYVCTEGEEWTDLLLKTRGE